MNDPAQIARRRTGGIALTLVILGVAAGAYLYNGQQGRSAAMRFALEREIVEAEGRSRAATKAALLAAEQERGKLATVAISEELLASVLSQWKGLAFKEPNSGLIVTIQSVTPKFVSGFPKVVAGLQAQWQGHTMALEAEGVLKHELAAGGVNLQFIVLGVAAPEMPSGLRSITSAKLASEMNAVLRPFAAPLQPAFEFTPKKQPIADQWVPMPNGRVRLQYDVPAPPPLKIDWQPVAVFFDEKGLRILARISTAGPLPRATETTPPANATAPGDDEMRKLLANWPERPAAASYFIRLPAHGIVDLLHSINGHPEAARTIKIRSNGSEGNLMEKTGGLPFGNGFRASLERPDSLQANAVLSAVRAAWRAPAAAQPGGVAATGKVAARGKIQVHVHGNPAKVFGRNLGGGAGSSVGATATASTDVTVALTYRDTEGEFALQIESPAETRATVDIGGVPDELEHWFKAGFNVPLPVNRDLYRFKLPAVIAREIKVSMPKGFTPDTRTIEISLETPKVDLKADALEISGKVTSGLKQP